jgi:hypothetical protein
VAVDSPVQNIPLCDILARSNQFDGIRLEAEQIPPSWIGHARREHFIVNEVKYEYYAILGVAARGIQGELN